MMKTRRRGGGCVGSSTIKQKKNNKSACSVSHVAQLVRPNRTCSACSVPASSLSRSSSRTGFVERRANSDRFFRRRTCEGRGPGWSALQMRRAGTAESTIRLERHRAEIGSRRRAARPNSNAASGILCAGHLTCERRSSRIQSRR